MELRISPQILQQKASHEKYIADTIQQREQASGEVSKLKRRLEKTVGQLTVLQQDMKALRKGKEITKTFDSDDDVPMGDSDHTTTLQGYVAHRITNVDQYFPVMHDLSVAKKINKPLSIYKTVVFLNIFIQFCKVNCTLGIIQYDIMKCIP